MILGEGGISRCDGESQVVEKFYLIINVNYWEI